MKAFFVNNRLAFGSAITSWDHVANLRAKGVTHVINLRHHENEFIVAFSNLWLAYRDDLKPRPASFYRSAFSFYGNAMRVPKAKIFVMCHHGYRRSPALVYFFLRATGMSPSLARERVVEARQSARVARAYRISAEEFLSASDIRGNRTGRKARPAD
jgi:hypothetical protein